MPRDRSEGSGKYRCTMASRRWLMNAIVWLLIAVTAAPGAADTPPAAATENAVVHQPAIDALRDHYEGIFDGTGCADRAGLCPSEPIERWEMAVWLVRVLDGEEPAHAITPVFADIDGGVWWAAHTERLAELGITRGCETGPLRYCPYEQVKRGQMATFLVKAFDLPPGPVAGFADVAATGVHAPNIDALAEAGITAGCDTRRARYCPEKPVTRAQMATFLARATGVIEIPEPTPPTYTAVTAGGFHTCALDTDGAIQCWGYNEDNQANPPTGTYTTITAGREHTCALDTGGAIQCWGNNAIGQTDAPSGSYTTVTAGGFHTCALDTGGAIRCWGNNDRNQATPPTGSYTAITAGWQHTCALDTGGSIECWGDNTIGQTSPPSGSHTSISAGAFHTCALTTIDTVTCWGNNENGQTNTPRRSTTYTDTRLAFPSGNQLPRTSRPSAGR